MLVLPLICIADAELVAIFVHRFHVIEIKIITVFKFVTVTIKGHLTIFTLTNVGT